MITFKQKGDFSHITKYLKNHSNLKSRFNSIFEKYGKLGLERLAEHTPKDTGLTSRSWSYEINYKKDSISLNFSNSNIQNGLNVAILIQFGHGTASGHWVSGRDYLTPALLPVLDSLSEALWEEVVNE